MYVCNCNIKIPENWNLLNSLYPLLLAIQAGLLQNLALQTLQNKTKNASESYSHLSLVHLFFGTFSAFNKTWHPPELWQVFCCELPQHAKKVMSNSPGLVDFPVGLVDLPKQCER